MKVPILFLIQVAAHLVTIGWFAGLAKAATCAVDEENAVNAPVTLSAPVAGPVTSSYGIRRDPILGMVRHHPGIDYDGRPGEPVHAAAGGTVVFAGSEGEYGFLVIVRHPQFDFETAYAHLAKITIRAGDCVARGQKIGAIGMSGRSSHPHLHFEVRRAIDPAALLAPLKP